MNKVHEFPVFVASGPPPDQAVLDTLTRTGQRVAFPSSPLTASATNGGYHPSPARVPRGGRGDAGAPRRLPRRRTTEARRCGTECVARFDAAMEGRATPHDPGDPRVREVLALGLLGRTPPSGSEVGAPRAGMKKSANGLRSPPHLSSSGLEISLRGVSFRVTGQRISTDPMFFEQLCVCSKFAASRQ